MTDEQMAKLPKWAQLEVRGLMSNLREAERINRQHLGEYDPKRPSYGDYDDLRGLSLPCQQVWFREADIVVKVNPSGDGIHIMGDSQLLIEPSVTNVIVVRTA